MRDVQIHRPITVPKLAMVLGTKPHQLMAYLIKKSIFPGPVDPIDDLVAIELAASRNVNLQIIDEEDGGLAPPTSPPKPPLPSGGPHSTKIEPNNPCQTERCHPLSFDDVT